MPEVVDGELERVRSHWHEDHDSDHGLPFGLDFAKVRSHGAEEAAGGGPVGEFRQHGARRGAPACCEIRAEEDQSANNGAEESSLPVPAADKMFNRVGEEIAKGGCERHR